MWCMHVLWSKCAWHPCVCLVLQITTGVTKDQYLVYSYLMEASLVVRRYTTLLGRYCLWILSAYWYHCLSG